MMICEQCGEPFVPAWNKPRQRFCSYECRLREQIARRRAQKLTGVVEMTAREKAAIAAVYARAASRNTVRCYLCGEVVLINDRHVDHIVPLSRGGRHVASNLAVACAACNLSKSAKLPEEVGVLV